MLFRRGARAFFIYGFAKSARDNIRIDEVKAHRKLAAQMLNLSERTLAAVIKNATVTEIRCNG